MLKKIYFLIVLLLAVNCNSAFSYEGVVHRKLNENASNPANSTLNDFLKNKLGITKGIEQPLKKGNIEWSISEWLSYGGEAEDYGYWPKNNKLNTRAFNHFHDPLEDWDAAYLKSSLDDSYIAIYQRYPVSAILWGLDPGRQDFSSNFTGDWSWGKAKESYYIYLTGKNFAGDAVADTEAERNTYLADCFRALGQVMHLLQDMSVPLHTRNDVHILPLTKNPKALWTYETYTKKYLNDVGEHKLDFIPDQSGDKPNPHFFEVPVIIQDPNYSNMVPVTGLFDRNAYNASGPIPPSNILGLAEYSNANFHPQLSVRI